MIFGPKTLQNCIISNPLNLSPAMSAHRKTHLARTIVARLREQGEAVHLARRTQAARKSWTGWWWRRLRSWTWRSGRTWPGTERRREVPAAGRLPAVAGRAGLLGRALCKEACSARALCKEACSAEESACKEACSAEESACKGACSAKESALQRSVLCKGACSAKKQPAIRDLAGGHRHELTETPASSTL